ncbi:hypothetical protein Pint_08928 [Pistacia integerrima]|uniref:Uncharacterized protein n=1 Tax=Pistacia integerrima TaxID=434235 RepID=A0ACC0XVQ6_9ROSI|nr:hypothetical protein Pint_08928 [Pistacia integerrima]
MSERSCNTNQDNGIGIPSGLNRIKTREIREAVSSKDHQPSSKPNDFTESRSYGVSRPPHKPDQKQKNTAQAQGHGKVAKYSKHVHKGKKIARWFSSHIPKFNHVSPNTEDHNSEARVSDEEVSTRTKLPHEENHLSENQSSAERVSSKVSKGLKSFSHELGPKGGIPSTPPRAHSYNDLKELLDTLHSRFDAAKEVVNTELATFATDVRNVLEKMDSTFSEGQDMAKDLLILAQQCIEMTSSLFRVKCETIVQELTEKRQQCEAGLVKWLFTRMLFILTRYTRLLLFQKESEPIAEKSLHKFKKCLESIPAVETSWVPTAATSGYALYQEGDTKHKLKGQNKLSAVPEASQCSSSGPPDQNSVVIEQKLSSQKSQIYSSSQEQQFHQVDDSLPEKSVNVSSYGSLHEQEQNLDGSDSVICRICEETVPISHLESHSYICAYADKCESNCLDVDDHLLKLAEILEQIIDLCNLSSNPTIGSPEKIQTTNSAIQFEGYSPKISEWRNKGVEGMFEDIHEMDTAFIDDSHLSSINMKCYLGMKLSNYGASSSTGSMTSVSSTNTPRTGHFDSFWLEHNNPSEREDVQQMIELADIARCVADTDPSKEGSTEFLLACMQDLQDILQRSKLKALAIDTFRSRIEKLLREKYILAFEVVDAKSPTSYNKHKENSRLLLDNASQSSASTPLHSSHKERTSIDDFEIIKPVSRGAFGKVFLARKRTTGDLFAIKVLKKLDMIRKNDIERILAERNILITVRNPFVVRFFYSFTCRDNLYLVMEYLNGGDLYSLLRKVGCLEEHVARIYIAELVLALEYLHSLGIVHRDLKPDNILIAHDGHIKPLAFEDMGYHVFLYIFSFWLTAADIIFLSLKLGELTFVKLTDFGLSKIGLINNTIDLSGPGTDGTMSLDSHNPDGQQTEDRNQNSAVGTPDYLAPEILLGTEHGYAADWWSVGIILFEFITGIPPFTAERPEIIFDNILNRKIPWPHVPDDMSFEAQDLINRFLIHDPNQRIGAKGAAEVVKAHPFFNGVNWDSLALQKAAFVPQPESIDDTSYFLSRFSQISSGFPDDQNSSNSDIDTCGSSSNSGIEMDECADLTDFNSSPLDLSLINFSFKNLSQLAAINHDVLIQNGRDSAKGSPAKGPGV